MATSPYDLRVSDVMTKDPVTVKDDTTLHECLQRMMDYGVSTLPVVDHDRQCAGVVSATDLLHVTREVEEDLSDLDSTNLAVGSWLLKRLMDGAGHRRVREVMSEDPATASPEMRLTRAATEMLRNRIHHLPVIDIRDRLVGIVSMTDIVSAFVDGDPNSD